LSVLSITGLASESSRASAPPKTATKASAVATPANSESANEGAASGSKRSSPSFFSARATTLPVPMRPPLATTEDPIELGRVGGGVPALRATVLGAIRGLEDARAASAELAERRGVAQEEARIRREREGRKSG